MSWTIKDARTIGVRLFGSLFRRLVTLKAGSGITITETMTGDECELEIAATGGGGGTLDHAALTSNLAWTSSGHTGTASRIAGFDGGGAAAYYAIGTDLQAYSATLAAIAAVNPGTAGLSILALADEGAAGEVLTSAGPGVPATWEAPNAPSGSFGALGTLLNGADQPNNDCWVPVCRTAATWEWQPRTAVPGRRCQTFMAGNTSTTPNILGFEGTSSLAGTSASIVATVGSFARRYLRYTSNATTGQQAGVSPGGVATAQVQLQTAQLLVYGIRWPTDITAVRVRVGMSASPNNVVWAASTPPNNTLDIRYDPGAGDTEAMLSSKDTTTPLTAAFTVSRAPVAGDWWDLAFSFAPSGASVQVWVAVNGGVWTLCATRATSLPVATTSLYLHAGLETREPVAKNIGVGSCYLVAA